MTDPKSPQLLDDAALDAVTGGAGIASVSPLATEVDLAFFGNVEEGSGPGPEGDISADYCHA